MSAGELVGVAEVADRLEVGKPTVSTWVARGLMPRPVVELACGRVWRWSDVYAWAGRTGRLATLRGSEVTAQDMATAERMLGFARRQTISELADLARACERLLVNDVRRPAPRLGQIGHVDGRSNGCGEWDWMLPAGERKRLRAHMTTAPTALEPDQLAAAMGSDDVEETMREWQRATLLVDALRSVRSGRAPSTPVDVLTTYDPAELWGPEPIEYVARYVAADREACEAFVEEDAEPLGELEEVF